ncbi:MAG: hypothetical protein JST20_12370, partial [Bacteroidetes bacterium]|nr:hypothetical protein [Bacteroidota bacterium]
MKRTSHKRAQFGKIVAALLILVAISLTFTVGTLTAQENVGIGTKNPDNSSVLDLSIDLLSSPKGFLAPRMTSLQKNSILAPATGLLIYQTDGSNGFYYFNGLTWIPFISSVTTISSMIDTLAWTLRGNAGTTNANFLGTTDQRDLVIKSNNVERLRITSQGEINVASLSTGGIVKALPGNGTLVTASVGFGGDVEAPLSFTNGLTRSGNTVTLGGGLVNNTALILNNNNFVFSGQGNVGIGVDNPTYKLEVGGAPGSSSVRLQSLAGTGIRLVTATALGELNTLNLPGGNVVGGSGTANFLTKWAADGLTLQNSQLFDNGTNVGVGTANPLALFSVGTNSQFQINSTGAITTATGINSSGNIQFSSLSAGGIVKADPITGKLSVALPGLDFEKGIGFSNGLTRSGDSVRFGGTLNNPTSLNIGANDFNISIVGNTGNVIIGKFTSSGIVKNSASGVL